MRSRLREEDGATAVLLVASVFVLFGAAMLGIDAGSLWTARRHLITGTDAAAHGGALAHAEARSCSTWTSHGEASDLFDTNVPDATMEDYDVTCTAGGLGGTVRVDGRQPAPLFFAPIFGKDSTTAVASSTAEWGALQAAESVRPLAFCYFDDHIQEWIGSDYGTTDTYRDLAGTDDPGTPYPDHPVYDGAGVVHRIPFTKDMDLRCGDPPGAWGWLDFNGNDGPNGASALKERLERGYEGAVDLGEDVPGDENCEGTPGGSSHCPGESGANATTDKVVQDHLVCGSGPATSDCPSYLVIVHDDVFKDGGDDYYHPVAFLGIVIRGANKVNAKQGWFDLEFSRFAAQGRVGPHTNGGVPGPYGVEICATEYAGTHDDLCDY